jgi:hypothetical protein
MVDIDGSEISTVVDQAEIASPTSYGTKVLIHASSGEGYECFVMNDDGTAREELPGLYNSYDFMCSPDGSTIAYLAIKEWPTTELKIMNTATGEDIAAELEVELEGDLIEWSMVWSPDSQHIAYTYNGHTGGETAAEIHIARRDLSCSFLAYRLSDIPQDAKLIAWIK